MPETLAGQIEKPIWTRWDSFLDKLWIKVKYKYGGKPPSSAAAKKCPLHGKCFPKDVVTPKVGENDLTQNEANQMMPPGCSVWRGNTRGEWCSHQRPHKRRYKRWDEFAGDSYQALLALVRDEWEVYLFDNGLEQSVCPIREIL